MRILTCFAFSCGLLCAAAPAFAQTKAVVLGIRSVEGDDDVAHDMTQALRTAATEKSGWSLSESAVSMTQMALAHGCEEVDAACLSQIAKSLEVQRIVYGTVRRNSAQADYDYELTVSMFDAERGSIARTLNETVPRAEAGFRSMQGRAERMIAQLAGTVRDGVILIAANVPAAAVRLDDEPVGETTDGSLRLEGVSPGEHKVEIRASGFSPHVARVSVVAGGEASVHAELASLGADAPAPMTDTAPAGGGDLDWLGWTLVGVGAASLVGAGASALVVMGVEDDPLFVEYKNLIADFNENVGPEDEVKDVCVEAERGLPHGLEPEGDVEEVAVMCSTSDTFEVLQWVFLGTAVAAGGVGAYILLSSDGGDGAAAAGAARLSLRPTFDGRTAGLGATLRF